ncbi:MAG: DUF2807 domain-containing protein [Reichenbachiella sp.]
MKNYFPILSLIILFGTTSCQDNCENGSGSPVSTTLTIPSFNSIDFSIAGDVFLQQGEDFAVVAEGDDNIISSLSTTVSNDQWDIEFKNECYNDYELSITIIIPDIKDVELSGTGSITVVDFLETDNLGIRLGGSGEIVFENCGITNTVDISIPGSGEVEFKNISASPKDFNIDIDGSGKVYAYELESNNVDISIGGSGDCQVYATDNLNINIKGSGKVKYQGSPIVTQKNTGSGDVSEY